MVKVQIDLSKELHKRLKLYRDFYNFNNLAQAALSAIGNCFLHEELFKEISRLKKNG
jgi:hypothetical protein